MSASELRERSLCLLNAENLDGTFQPWLTIADAQFQPDVRSLYSSTNVNLIQSIQTDYLPSFISYLWPLVHRGSNVWAVDHALTKETASIKFVMKYDLLIWNILHRSTATAHSSHSDIVYPKVLILAPDWFTCDRTYAHLFSATTDALKRITMCCVYEGQNTESDLYKNLLLKGCDLLVATPTVVQDLIQKRHIHFEHLQLIVYDQIDLLLLQTVEPINELHNHLQLHSSKSRKVQHVFLSSIVNSKTQDFITAYMATTNNTYHYLSSSMIETYSYQNYLVYCEPCRNLSDRKYIVKEALDLAAHCQKKVLMCAFQTRRLATMQNVLNDLSIQSMLVHSQMSHEEIEQSIHEWRTINDRPLILLIQDEVLPDVSIDNADILIHLDIQRVCWYPLYNQRLKLMHRHLLANRPPHSINKRDLSSLKSIEKFYRSDPSASIPLIVLLWPGDCAQVTHELIDYLNHSQSYVHPLIERLAKNNCFESIQAKLDVELCPTLKAFGRCLTMKKLKRCPFRHNFHLDIDSIELRQDNEPLSDGNYLSKSFELFLPKQGEVELRVTHVSDGNRLWAHVLRSRVDTHQALDKIFDYDRFDEQIQQAFDRVQHRPLSEIIRGDVYLYSDEMHKIHRVYVHEQEQSFFDIRRADAILNRAFKSATTTATAENEPAVTAQHEDSSRTIVDRPALTVVSLDTGKQWTLKPHEHLYPVEPSSLKQYPPLAIEIVLCNIRPLDKITMTYTPFAIDTLRSLTLNEILMGRIRLATRSCLWIDPLVKPVRLAALKRVAYDKPVRKQLILSKLVEANDGHMEALERMALEANLIEFIVPAKEEEKQEEATVEYKPFLNRIGQLIINPVGRSKEFFSRHHQPSQADHEQPVKESQAKPSAHIDRHIPLGRGHRIHSETIAPPPPAHRAPSMPMSNVAAPSSIESGSTTPSKVGPKQMADVQSTDQNEDPDQMMFIFGPKMLSQFRQIKDMEDEQRRQADFPVHRNRHRRPRPQNQPEDEQVPAPNMSRYEPFVDERGPMTPEQVDYRQTQRKTPLRWEQTSRDVYLTVGFYNVDSTQTRVEFDRSSVWCRTKIRQYDRFVRIDLSQEIVPEKCSFQVRRSNILLSMRKANEGLPWTTLTDRRIEPRPEYFSVEYGSDDESDTDKRRRTVNRQWEHIRREKRELKGSGNNDDEKFLIDDLDDDEHPPAQGPADKFDDPDDKEKNQQELTDTSSDCHSTDSDDCYYEDQVPANHIPRGYDEADYDHRFYGQQIRT